jgi:PAS domain S-box-containing protein
MIEQKGDSVRLSPEEASLLAEISRVITESPDIEDVYARFAELVRPIIPFDRIYIVSLDRDKATLRNEFSHGVESEIEATHKGFTTPLAGSITEEVVETGSGVLFSPDPDTDVTREYPRHVAISNLGLRSAMTVPLTSGGECIGTLGLVSMGEGVYTKEHLRTAERIALQISGAVANSRLLARQKEIEDSLRSREHRFWELYEDAPIAYTSTDPDGLLVGANKRAREMFGYTSEEMIGRHARELLLADTPSGTGLAPDLNKRLLSRENIQGVELEFKRANGIHFWGSVAVRLVEGPDGEVAAYRSTIQDISAQKYTEDALKRSEANHRAFIESVDAAACLKDVSGRYLMLNQKMADAIGLPKGQIIGNTASGVYNDPVTVAAVEAADREVVETRGPVRDDDVQRPDGNMYVVRRTPVFNDQGDIIGIVAIATDVTQRRKVEGELRKVHEHYRTIVDNLEELVSLKDASGRFLLVNRAFIEAVGASKEVIEGGYWADFLENPEDVDDAERRHQEILERGTPHEFEVGQFRDGNPRTYHRRDTPLTDANGRVDRVVTIATDITERKRAEDALRRSELNHRTLIENMDAVVAFKDISGRFVVVNEAFCAVLGLPQENIIGKRARDLSGDPVAIEYIESQDREVIAAGGPMQFERTAEDGTTTQIFKSPILDGNGDVTGIVSAVFDVTELRSAEEELSKVHELNRIIVDSLQEQVALKDASGQFLLVNQAFADQIGLTKNEIEGRYREEFLLPEVAEISKRQHDEVVKSGKRTETETKVDLGDGPRTIHGDHIPIEDSEGTVERVVSVLSDITERKHVEDALKLSELNYRTLIENMDATVALKDTNGRYVVVNEAFKVKIGLPQEDIIGKTVADIFDDPDQVAFIESHDSEVIKSREPMQLAVWNDDDESIVHKAPVMSDEGTVIGIVAVVFDTTQLRAAEDELRRVHDRYRVLVDSLDESVALKDATGRILLVNQAYADYMGLP